MTFAARCLLLLLLPLASYALLGLGIQRLAKAAWVVVASVFAIVTAVSLAWLAGLWGGSAAEAVSVPWLHIGDKYLLEVGFRIDRPSALLLSAVGICATLVAVFAGSYMGHDPHKGRFFSLLSLFGAAMIGLVLAENLITLFVFWELVGVSSYLLVGFWHTRPDATAASLKAILVNRVGDVLLLAAIALFITVTGHSSLHTLADGLPAELKAGSGVLWGDILVDEELLLLTVAGLLFVFGAVAKSAQLPFSGWLPDAMAGPTPVSALIHAATMVAAGIYVVFRVYPLFTPQALEVIAGLGAVTLVYGAFSAMAQFDIKRVLAYSTISQLGYMLLGIGLGAPELGFFHLITHAFFKCGLFLSAAAVIHLLHEEAHEQHIDYDVQDMRLMGGLRVLSKPLFWLTLVLTAALVGLPGTSGFLSKDAILAQALERAASHASYRWIAALAFAGVGLTAYYMTRQLLLVYAGVRRQESLSTPKPMRVPVAFWPALVLLTALSLFMVFGFSLTDGAGSWVVTGLLDNAVSNESDAHGMHLWALLLSLGLVVVGIAVAIFRWRTGALLNQTVPMGLLRRLSFEGLYLSSLYRLLLVQPGIWLAKALKKLELLLIEGLILLLTKLTVGSRSNLNIATLSDYLDRKAVDGIVTGIGAGTLAGGKAARSLQTGRVQTYLLTGLLILLGALLLVVVLYSTAKGTPQATTTFS